MGYASYKRHELFEILKPDLGKILNKQTGIEANLSKHSVKRFVSTGRLSNGKDCDVLITVKETIANGHRIYSIELDEINKASERFRGLSDAAENTADRATKTPHVDTSNITHSQKNSSEVQ